MNKQILNNVLNKRSDLVRLIFVVFLLALGTGLIVNYLTIQFETKSNYLLIGGLLLIAVVFIYLIATILTGCKRTVDVSGVIAFDGDKVVAMDRYKFSEELSRTLKAVFLENEALKQSWSSDFEEKKPKKETIRNTTTNNKDKPISYYSIVRVEVPDDEFSKKNVNSSKILKEAVEYIFIEKLSTRLSTYFNEYKNEDKILKEFTRTDFPNILLENRIINLLSSPFEDRPIFLKAKMNKQEEKGEIIAIGGSDGSSFSRFDLVLPKKTKVIRKPNGVLQIKSPRLVLEFNIDYGVFGTTLPRGFAFNYLGCNSSKLDVKKIDLQLKVSIRPLALLFNKGWNYYNWIDSFANEFKSNYSFDTFVDKIEWESTLTRIIATNQRQKFAHQQEKKRKETKEKEQTTPNNGL